MINGVLNIDKAPGMTSHDVVAKVRRIAGQKKVGHAGTLDPDATGVLIVCLGHATRLADLLADRGKTYRAVLCLGVTTTTEDGSGAVIDETNASHITKEALMAAIPAFIGDIMQIPPMVSAVHHEGKRLYDLARQGITVEREARKIKIASIDLIDFTPGARPTATLDVATGKGAYIRTLCADIGAALGVGGHMAALRRTSVGVFGAGDASSVTLEQLAERSPAACVVAPSDAVSFLPLRTVAASELADLWNGKDLEGTGGNEAGQMVRMVSGDGELLALGRVTDDGAAVHPEKVFKD
ncbi:MAG TPA: tRNA pseudouridine(55) synthase TruB [Capsulimonadaceae bacterium]|jgi:tRNA pseudouridine55 synthase